MLARLLALALALALRQQQQQQQQRGAVLARLLALAAVRGARYRGGVRRVVR